MRSTLRLVVCLGAALSTASFAQESAATPASTTPVAYIYLESLPANASAAEVHGYAVSPGGTLTSVPGSPFQENEGPLAVNGKYLFGINRDRSDIDSFAIDGSGRLRYITSKDYSQYNPSGCGSPAWLFSDRTGANLYDMEFNGDCSNNGYQSFQVNEPSGGLNYLGYADGGGGSFGGVYLPLTFTGNDRFGYEASNNGCMYFAVWAYSRGSGGVLRSIDAGATMPAPPAGYRVYIPTMMAADPANHVAIAVQAANPPGCSSVAPQLGSFTADSKGNLTTNNTSANMPSTDVVSVTDLKVSPSGKLLAVAGTGGLQVFHFNGAQPPTHYTPLLTANSISQIFWDNDNHLYAVSPTAGKLYIFNVTPTAYEHASGSPHLIAGSQYLAVQPLPLK